MLGITQVAKELGLNPRTVLRMIHDGRIKGVKIASMWKITEEEVEKIKKGE
jgi:excisionase family DNA binding protein